MKAIIFDLQGTLVENGVFPSPVKQVKFILQIRAEFHAFVTRFEEVFMTRKYDSLKDAFIETAKEFNIEPDDAAIERLVGLWNKNKLLSRMFPDTIDVLEELKDYRLVLISNIDSQSRDIIQKFKLENYFHDIYLSCDIGMLKHKMLHEIIKDLGIDKSEIVYVGDSVESDMKAAEKAGMRGILIDRNGRQEYKEKISSLFELKALVG